MLRSHGKEGVQTDALSTLPGATSADVHTGLGHPGQGQTSNELRHEGGHTSSKQTSGLEGVGAEGGSGLHGDGMNAEFRRLQQDANHPSGPAAGRAHNVSLDGAESKMPVASEQVAAEGTKTRALNETNRSMNATGVPDRGAASDRS